MPDNLPKRNDEETSLGVIEQPEHLSPQASQSETRESDLAHINNTFDIAYAGLKRANKVSEFCSVIKAIQVSVHMRRELLGYDTGRKGASRSRPKVDLLG